MIRRRKERKIGVIVPWRRKVRENRIHYCIHFLRVLNQGREGSYGCCGGGIEGQKWMVRMIVIRKSQIRTWCSLSSKRMNGIMDGIEIMLQAQVQRKDGIIMILFRIENLILVLIINNEWNGLH